MRKSDWEKVIVWRCISIVVASFITYLYLGELRSSLELAVILTIVMTILHYFFEGWWNKREKPLELEKKE
jgi:uncharacterized membrane protein